jgi:hypothetical protein
LPRLGLSAPQLDAILNRADTDTAYEAFVKLRASRELEEANPGIPFGEIRRKSMSKRKRESPAEGGSSLAGGARATGSAQAESHQNTPEPKIAKLSSSRPTQMDTDNYADTYSYLFPISDGPNPDWSRYAAGPQQQNVDPSLQPFPGSPLGPIRDSQMQQYNAYTQEQQAQAARGMFPLGGSMYSPQMPMWGPFGAMSGDLSGFGLTLPPQPGQAVPQSMASMAGPSGMGGGANYPSNPLMGLSQPPGGRNTSSAQPDLSARDQQRLKVAVTMMVQSKGVTDGPAMSADEIEERMRVQRQVIESFKEDDGLRKRIEPMQVSMEDRYTPIRR